VTDVDFYDDAPLPDDPAEAEPEQAPSDNVWADRNRAEKCSAMVDAVPGVFALDGHADAEQISRELRALAEDDAWWDRLQKLAGYTKSKKVPGPITRQLVMDTFAQRATAAAHLEEE
jgi:hypothetical protein